MGAHPPRWLHRGESLALALIFFYLVQFFAQNRCAKSSATEISIQVTKVGKIYDVCLRSLKVDAFTREKKIDPSLPSPRVTLAAVMERSRRFRRVTPRRPPSRHSAGFMVVFSRHSAPLIFKQYLRVLPFDPAAVEPRAAINLTVFHLSRQRAPPPFLFAPRPPSLCVSSQLRIFVRERPLTSIYRNESRRFQHIDAEMYRRDFYARPIDRAKHNSRLVRANRLINIAFGRPIARGGVLPR